MPRKAEKKKNEKKEEEKMNITFVCAAMLVYTSAYIGEEKEEEERIESSRG